MTIVILGAGPADALPGDVVVVADELSVLAQESVTALVATATRDLVRAGALRDHLGIPGQTRAKAELFADPVATREHLRANGIPALPGARVLRVSDLYWLRHRWGALRVRHRDRTGWPTAAVLRTDADLRAYTANGLAPDLISTPALFAEPARDGDLCVAERRRAAVLAVLPTIPGHPYRVTLRDVDGEWLVDTVDQTPATPAEHRAAVRAQAGLAEGARWAS